jgi:hypothetical protein
MNPDLLAAVVLHTLVTDGRDGVFAREVAIACERDPTDPVAMGEIDVVLDILIGDDLAQRDGDLYKPTRAAIRASELSF